MEENPKVMALEDDVKEIKSDVKTIGVQLADLRVLIAGNYVSKEEFNKYKEAHDIAQRQLITWTIACAGVVASIVSVLVAVVAIIIRG